MLSYMLPVEEKPSSPRNLNLSLNLNTTNAPAIATVTGPAIGRMSSSAGRHGNNGMDSCDENTKLLASERAHILKNGATVATATRDLKLDNGIIKTTQRQLQQSNGDKDPTIEGGGGCGGGGTSAEDSSNCDDSKSTTSTTKKPGKLTKAGGTKNVTLKRVSFGSSKGSMVETLVFETPTPLPEHAERQFGFSVENHFPSTTLPPQQYGAAGGAATAASGKLHNNNFNHIGNSIINSSNNNNNSSCLDDSGIEMQEELERSKVRVTFFQSSKPQQVSPPESYINFADSNLPLLSDSFYTESSTLSENNMTAATAIQPSYDRQISTESGWDNPFRPGGDLSREADEIVNMIKGGKPITPTGDANHSIVNGNAQKDSGNHLIENGTVVDGATRKDVSQLQSTPAQNGTKSPQPKSGAPGSKVNGDTKSSGQTQVSSQVIPGPTSASHVVIEDKKKKKCTCCVIQ